MDVVADWAEVGERVRQARLADGLTQAQLAERTGLGRSAVAKVESGTRHLDALELFRLADALGLPIAHFVTRPPAPIVSRRAALPEEPDAAARERSLLDADLETHTRDTAWLVRRRLLHPPPLAAPSTAGTPEQARELARQARGRVGYERGPLGPLTEVCEAFELYVRVTGRDADGASLLADRFGVAVVGGRGEPGRRRFTAAHELGHHLLGDEYHTDVGVAASRDEREHVVDAFAAELLLPEDVVISRWADAEDAREALVALAGVYRVSWSVVLDTAHRLGLVDTGQRQALRGTPLGGASSSPSWAPNRRRTWRSGTSGRRGGARCSPAGCTASSRRSARSSCYRARSRLASCPSGRHRPHRDRRSSTAPAG
ncbi:MAG TPA: helix-turn-helix domain-containing protein [Frankiaceae bacterium]|nr:helix-turn-helix domain-containing protein [Frankiaceae bacterium]